MTDCEREEATNLVCIYTFKFIISTRSIIDLNINKLSFQQKEFEWVLNQEVHKGLEQIHQILVVCN